MNQIGAKIRGFFNTRLGFLVLAIVLFWAKTYWAYQAKFNLGVTGSFQHLILAVNPIPTTLFLLELLYICRDVNRMSRC